MKKLFLTLVLLPIVATTFISSVSPAKRRALLNSLDQTNVSQHFAFYQLYTDTPEGKIALSKAFNLLMKDSPLHPTQIDHLPLDSSIIDKVVGLVNKQANVTLPCLSEEELLYIESIASHLPNRKLRGYKAASEFEVVKLHPHEVDLARGLMLSQMSQLGASMNQVRSYEAMIDLMALQILAKVSFKSSDQEKIRAMNHFIFHEMGYRFPPHSLYAKDIDVYTFLPSVLDSRKGVCLGVSILYLCLAQRLSLPLEMITPPGHIYVRYNDGTEIINIETTARGIHVDCREYLSIGTRSLQQRTIKEVIGLAHINQGSLFWHNEKYDKAIECYKIAEKYLPDDFFLKELLAYNYLFTGNEEAARPLLYEVSNHFHDYAVSKDTIAEDLILGKVNAEGVKAVYASVDETRDSIIKKKEKLSAILKEFPEYRSGILAMAVTYLQLHRYGEGLEWLEKYHKIDPTDATVEYYLAALYGERYDYPKAWYHFHLCEELLKLREHKPKVMSELKRELCLYYPHP